MRVSLAFRPSDPAGVAAEQRGENMLAASGPAS